MRFESDVALTDSVTAWIDDALTRPTPQERHRLQEAADHGMIGRIQAIRGALSSARAGKSEALGAAFSMARRVFVMATVYDLEDVRSAALAIERGCDSIRDGVTSGWADIALALASFQDILHEAPAARRYDVSQPIWSPV
jgi:hypothetical protein